MNRPEENMDEFERQLSRAMKRVNAPETMAKFVMLAAEAEQRRMSPGPKAKTRILAFPKPPMWLSGAIAAVLVLGIFVGAQVHQRAQEQKARQQFETAIRVTDHALDQTRAQLERAGLNLGD